MRAGRFSFAVEFGDDFDGADDVGVDFRQFVGRNPVSLMNGAADRFDFEFRRVFRTHLESRDESRFLFGVLSIPSTGNLSCVFLVEDWVKDRLAWRRGGNSRKLDCRISSDSFEPTGPKRVVRLLSGEFDIR